MKAPDLNYDGLQIMMIGWWDPPQTDFDHPLAGVSEGVDYGFIDRDVEWWKEE